MLCDVHKLWIADYNPISVQQQHNDIGMDNKAITKLFDEVSFLKGTSQFMLHFRPKYLLLLYEQLAASTSVQLHKLANKIERDMEILSAKCVYIELKWLAFQHQLLQNDPTVTCIERVVETLTKLPHVVCKDNFEEYINNKLVNAYRQYLMKLAAILMSKAGVDCSPTKGKERKENEPAYCMYNLISYSLQEFSRSIKEFGRFFHRFFPCLNDYIGLVGKDLSKFMKKIRLSYQKGALTNLTFLQVEQMQSQLSIFSINAQKFTNSWIFPETNAQSINFEEEVDLREEKIDPQEEKSRMALNLIAIVNKH